MAVEPAIDFILILNFYIAPPSHVSIIKLVSLGRDMTHLRAASLRGGPAFGRSQSLFSKGAPAACWAHLDFKPQSCMAKNFAICVTGKYLN